MFGKTRNGPATKPATTNSGPISPSANQPPSDIERTIERFPNRHEIRDWTHEHPWLALGSGVAAGYLATRLWSGAQRVASRAPEVSIKSKTSKPLVDSRGLRRASAALWLIPLFEVTRIGLETVNAYRQHAAGSDTT